MYHKVLLFSMVERMDKALAQSIWMMLHAVDQRHLCYLAPMTVTLLTAPMLRMLELDAIHVSNISCLECKFLLYLPQYIHNE